MRPLNPFETPGGQRRRGSARTLPLRKRRREAAHRLAGEPGKADTVCHERQHRVPAPVQLDGLSPALGNRPEDLPGAGHGPLNRLDGPSNVRMMAIPEMSHGGAQVHRTDEDAVKSRHRQDVVDVSDGFERLDLGDDQDLIVRSLEVAASPALVGGASAPRDAALSPGRVEACRDGLRCLTAVVHIGNDNTLRPGIQDALEPNEIIPRCSHQGSRSETGDRAKL